MADDQITDAECGELILLSAKWLWTNAPHEMQRTALEHVTDNPEVVDGTMEVLIRVRRERQAELN